MITVDAMTYEEFWGHPVKGICSDEAGLQFGLVGQPYVTVEALSRCDDAEDWFLDRDEVHRRLVAHYAVGHA